MNNRLSRALKDEYSAWQATQHRDDYTISASLPLIDYPIASIALHMFQFAFGDHHWQQYSTLLRTVFIVGGMTEMAERDLHFIELQTYQ